MNEQIFLNPSLFDTFPEPVLQVSHGKLSFFNPSAARLFRSAPLAAGGPLPAELSGIIPAESLNASFVTPDHVISDAHYHVTVSPLQDGFLIVLRLTKDVYPLPEKLLKVFSGRLRTNLNTLLSATSLLAPAVEATKNPDYIKYLSIINQSHYRLLRILGSLTEANTLLSTQAEAQPLENTDLAAFCRNLAEAANSLAGSAGRTVRFSCSEDRLVMAVCRNQIERLLLNLISNALKFTPIGETVLVTLSPENELALLSVSNPGEGLDSGEMATAFSHFEAGLEPVAKPKGLGLGLTLVRYIAERHGGSVMLESRPGKGTTVMVSLPVIRLEDSTLHTSRPPVDYSGGFSNLLVELSDALPPEAFLPQNLDQTTGRAAPSSG